MSKGLGIAALVLILISFPIPFVGTWIGYLALVVAAVAALFGDRALTVATAVIAAIKMYFLSPVLMATMYVKVDGFGFNWPLAITSFFVALPVAMLAFRPMILAMLKQAGLFK